MSLEQAGPLPTGLAPPPTPGPVPPIPWSWDEPADPDGAERELVSAEDEKRYAATQLQLVRRRFVRNRVALVAGLVIVGFYLTALFANFLAPYGADRRFDAAIYVPPQPIYLVDDGRVYPHVLGLKQTVDPETLRRTYAPDPYTKVPIQFFAPGEPYQLFGLIPTATCSASRAATSACSCSGPTARGATSSRGC